MAISTAPLTRPTRTHRRWTSARSDLAQAYAKVAKMVSAARHHNWSPALTISGLGCIDIAAWETFGRGAAWLALGASLLVYDWQRER